MSMLINISNYFDLIIILKPTFQQTFVIAIKRQNAVFILLFCIVFRFQPFKFGIILIKLSNVDF